jgi:hypothetical protein
LIGWRVENGRAAKNARVSSNGLANARRFIAAPGAQVELAKNDFELEAVKRDESSEE